MVYVAIAIGFALVGILPLLIKGRLTHGIGAGIAYTALLSILFYLSASGFVGPLGGFGTILLILVLWLVSVGISLIEEDGIRVSDCSLPALALCTLFGGLLLQSGCFRADDYAKVIGPVEERVWTQDIQPKDETHMRMSTEENATFMATKVVGTMGAIGSQFTLKLEDMTLQKVGNDFLFICPLDFKGFGAWKSTEGVPGYVVVDGEDPRHDASFVELAKDKLLVYTPEAFFSKNLIRHVRLNGHLTTGLTDYTFEIDDKGEPWWVISTYKPTILWSGQKITGVLLVHATTGEIIFKPLGQVPTWVDRAESNSFVQQYLNWQGNYSGGWYNQSFWPWAPGKNITKAEKPNLIYGEGGQPEWVVGITSNGGKDDSLVALVYINSRTGKAVQYEMKGGTSDTGVLNAVDSHPYLKQRQLHGTDPQLYNVMGKPTAVVPLFSDNHAFSGVAMVDIKNVQLMGVGANQYEALREYERVLSQGSGQEAIEKKRDRQFMQGTVDRFGSEVSSNGTSYYLHLIDVPHLFVAGATQFPKLPVTTVGDQVRIGYDAGNKDVLVMVNFDNLSLPLSRSKTQKEIAARSEAKRTKQEAGEDAATVLERVKNLTPEELQKLGKQVPPQ